MVLNYKGFTGSVEYSEEDQCFHGKILDIYDLFMYDGDTLEELEKHFQESVDDYIEWRNI